MRTPGDRFTTALVITGAVASLMACDRDVAGPGMLMPSAQHAQIGVMSVPANDDFDAAVIVPGLPFSDAVNTSEATTAADDPDCFGQGPTVWYAFTPTEDGFYEANTFGSDYDTTLGAYTGTRGNLTEIACNDDSGTLQSEVVIELQAGETVYFMVGAFASGPGGNLIFNLQVGSPPLEVGLTIDQVGSVDPRTGIATISGTLTCSRPTFVDLFGILQDRIGRIRIEAPFFGFFFCEGSTRWEAPVIAENALLVGGPVEVFVAAFFLDPISEDFAIAEQEATVRLRGRPGSSSISATSGAGGETAAGPFRSLKDVMRNDARLK